MLANRLRFTDAEQLSPSHRRLLRAAIRGVTGLVLAVLGPVLAYALTATLGEILADPDRFDGQVVTTSGTITNLRETVSRHGDLHYTFDLSDGTHVLPVLSF